MSARSRLLLAAGLCFLALGLAWETTPGSAGYLAPGYATPGSCVSTYDGSLDCTPGTYQAGPGYSASF